MASRNWRNAASLIIASRAKQNNKIFDYELMMLKRSSKSSFMPTAYVYPGGVIEKTDFSPSWLDVFASHGALGESLVQQFVSFRRGPAPLLYKDVGPSSLLPEIGYRISAIRETFEETGILFCKTRENEREFVSGGSIDLHDWRRRVAKDPSQFETLCKTHQLCPNIWSLYEWSNWLTPVDTGPIRFDTIFYMCVLKEQPTILIDNEEITNFVWTDPVSSVKKHMEKEIWLAPPQLYETNRLSRFTNLEELGHFARGRQSLGVDRWIAVRFKTLDGTIWVLPGDSLYPEKVNLFENRTEVLENETVESSRKKSERLHRYEALSPVDFHIKCNIQVAHGHVQPIDLIEVLSKEGAMQKELSKL